MLAAASSTVMLGSPQPSADAAAATTRSRPSFPSFVRTLLLLVSPSSASSGSGSGSHAGDGSTLGAPVSSNGHDGLEDRNTNSLFLEAYYSFPALDESSDEATLVNHHCAADRIRQQHPPPLMVGSNQVLC